MTRPKRELPAVLDFHHPKGNYPGDFNPRQWRSKRLPARPEKACSAALKKKTHKMYKIFILYKSRMHTISLSEFRANASAMIDRVEQGETVRILRHGKPVAELVGVKPDLSARVPSYKRPFEPLLQLPPGYSAVKALLDERDSAPW